MRQGDREAGREEERKRRIERGVDYLLIMIDLVDSGGLMLCNDFR